MSPKKSRREAILNAAAALVREEGAAHLTLDAVSTRAKVSKGGLLYHFETKEALLEAMVARLIEELEGAKEREYAKLPPSPARSLKAHVMSMKILQRTDIKPIANALLAAGAHDPGLLRQAKKAHEEMIEEMKSSGLSSEFVKVIIFAALGLDLSNMLGVAGDSSRKRQAFFDELLRLIAEEEVHL